MDLKNLLINLFIDFINQIKFVFINGVFGLTLIELFIIFLITILAIMVRGLFAKFLVDKITKIVLKTSNQIDDKIFDCLLPPLRILPLVLVFFFITLYFNPQSTLGLFLQKINNTLSTIFVFWLIHQMLCHYQIIFIN